MWCTEHARPSWERTAILPTLPDMQVKIFVLDPGRKTEMRYDKLEHQINSWLRKNPEVEVRLTTPLTQPNEGAGHIALAVWYDLASDE